MEKNVTFNLSEIVKHCRDFNQRETIALLKCDLVRFWSWGATAITFYGKKALRFKVNGHHFKGHVYITLNASDLYNVYLVIYQNNTIKEEIKDIYFDDLFDRIDEKIEKIPIYSR